MSNGEKLETLVVDPGEFLAMRTILLSLVSIFAHVLAKGGWSTQQFLDMIAEACDEGLPPQETEAAERLRAEAKAQAPLRRPQKSCDLASSVVAYSEKSHEDLRDRCACRVLTKL